MEPQVHSSIDEVEGRCKMGSAVSHEGCGIPSCALSEKHQLLTCPGLAKPPLPASSIAAPLSPLAVTSLPEPSEQIAGPSPLHEGPHCLLLGLVFLRGRRKVCAAGLLSSEGHRGSRAPGIGCRRPGKPMKTLELCNMQTATLLGGDQSGKRAQGLLSEQAPGLGAVLPCPHPLC